MWSQQLSCTERKVLTFSLEIPHSFIPSRYSLSLKPPKFKSLSSARSCQAAFSRPYCPVPLASFATLTALGPIQHGGSQGNYSLIESILQLCANQLPCTSRPVFIDSSRECFTLVLAHSLQNPMSIGTSLPIALRRQIRMSCREINIHYTRPRLHSRSTHHRIRSPYLSRITKTMNPSLLMQLMSRLASPIVPDLKTMRLC